MFKFVFVIFIFLSTSELVFTSLALPHSRIVPAAPNATEPASRAAEWLDKRQAAAPVTTCGYGNGDPKDPRTADPGYGCRVDTANGLWGFCPTTVISAEDCGLAGMCVDTHSCTSGCGRLSGRADITTFSCEAKQFCSTVLLINGPDLTFDYIACGDRAATDSLLAVPKTVDALTTSTSSFTRSTSSASQTSLKSTGSAPPTSTSLTLSSSTSSNISPSSTRNPSPTPPEQKSTPIGAIVGGVIGGLTVICLTILGVLLIRRKRGATEEFVASEKPPFYTHTDRNDDAELKTRNLRYIQKGYQWNSSQGPVEMYGGHHVNMEPVELQGKTPEIK